MVYYLFSIGAVLSKRVQKFFVKKEALGQVFLLFLRFSLVGIIPLRSHAHLLLYNETCPFMVYLNNTFKNIQTYPCRTNGLEIRCWEGNKGNFTKHFSKITFFLCGYLKGKVYVDKPRDIPQLKNAIETELRSIPRRMCEQVFTNFSLRLNEYVKNQGRHLNDVIFHVWQCF